jgi:hypothetical protein
MRGRLLRIKLLQECEGKLLEGLRLKVKFPLWHEVDRILDELKDNIWLIKYFKF